MIKMTTKSEKSGLFDIFVVLLSSFPYDFPHRQNIFLQKSNPTGDEKLAFQTSHFTTEFHKDTKTFS